MDGLGQARENDGYGGYGGRQVFDDVGVKTENAELVSAYYPG